MNNDKIKKLIKAAHQVAQTAHQINGQMNAMGYVSKQGGVDDQLGEVFHLILEFLRSETGVKVEDEAALTLFKYNHIHTVEEVFLQTVKNA